MRIFHVLIIAVMLLCLSSACSHSTQNSITQQHKENNDEIITTELATESETESYDVAFQTGTYNTEELCSFMDSENAPGLYKGNMIPDKETAIKVATVIFQAQKGSDFTKDYLPSSVWYDEADHIWMVLFRRAEDIGEPVSGGGYTIVLRESDGQVIGFWAGE